MIFDDTLCSLGEGALWHPIRGSLFWFDINNKRMFERAPDEKAAKIYQFSEHVSAAGWVNEMTLLIASEIALFSFNLKTCESTHIVGLEADNPMTRSNDGRADPKGGFWIGTMGKNAEPGVGSIYRYYHGELCKLYAGITIPNSICFSPNGQLAYYCDTMTRQIMKQQLDTDGWPDGAPELFADVAPFAPDGSVMDSQGYLWNAQWGAYRVARYDPKGAFVGEIRFSASQMSCPAFGGADMDQLFATSARENLKVPNGDDGKTFIMSASVRGQEEYQVML